MPWDTFHCDDPDFTVRSIPDGDFFKVKRECLIRGSNVFRDMFSCCDSGYVLDTLDEDNQSMELPESAVQLNMLFHVLHHLPEVFVPPASDKPKDFTRVEETVPEHAIPFPLLPALFRLADKYAFSQELVERLYSHLAAYASTYPLRVYGLAVGLGLDKIAAKASIHLLHPPLASYSAEEMRVVPTAEAYHKLVLLHDFRIRRLKEILMEAEIFPHGYGECPRHASKANTLWANRKDQIVNKIQAATDVASEMLPVNDELANCTVCEKACSAAIAMLGYKCGRIPKRIDKISG